MKLQWMISVDTSTNLYIHQQIRQYDLYLKKSILQFSVMFGVCTWNL